MKIVGLIFTVSLGLVSCMSTRTYYGDDVYVVKPNELPVGESATDQTSYSSFKNRTREGRVSTVYYAVPFNYLGMDCYNTLFWNTGCRYGFAYGYNPYGAFYNPHNFYGYDPFFNPYFAYYNPYGYYGNSYYGYNNYGLAYNQPSSNGVRIQGPRHSGGGFANPRAVDIANNKSQITTRTGKDTYGKASGDIQYRSQYSNSYSGINDDRTKNKPNTTYTPTDRTRVSSRTNSSSSGTNFSSSSGRNNNSTSVKSTSRSSGEFKGSASPSNGNSRSGGSTGRSGGPSNVSGGRR